MSIPSQECGVTPYLTVSDASKTILFYEEVFGAKVLGKMDADDGKRIMHATLQINGKQIMLSDEFPEFSPFRAPDKNPISPVAMSLRFDDVNDVDRVYNLALDNGATSCWPPEDMFWGDRFCQIIDPACHRWMFVSRVDKNQN